MNELHTMPLKVERLFSSRKCRNMTLQQFGAFMRLLCEAWLEGAHLPSDESELRQMLGEDGQCDRIWDDVKANVLDRMFAANGNGTLFNETQQELYAETLAKTQKHSDAGRKAANARWHADAMRSQSNRNAIGMPSKAKAKAKAKDKDPPISPPGGSTTKGCRGPSKQPTPEETAIYQAYPRKVAKQPGLRAIRKALKTVSAGELLAKVQQYAEAVADQDKEFVPHPATWFNAERWDDDPKEWAPQKQIRISKATGRPIIDVGAGP